MAALRLPRWWLRGSRTRRRRRPLVFLGMGVVMSALAITAYATHVLRATELSTVDARFSIRGAKAAPNDIVVVGVDEASLNTLKQRWPFPRSWDARVTDQLRLSGAKVIAFDTEFTQQTSPAQDNALITAVDGAHGRVVLSTLHPDPQGHTNIFGGDQVLRSVGARPGFGGLYTDPGGVIRHMPYEASHLKSFSVTAAEVAEGHPISAAHFAGDQAWIDYAGPPGTVKTVSFASVYRGQVAASLFRGKVVVIGVTDPLYQDVHSTAFSSSELMAGPEIQANAISTALRGFPLRGLPGWLNIALIAIAGLLAPLGTLRLGPLRATVAVVLVAAAYTVVAQLAFNGGRIIPVLYPLGALALGFVGTVAIEAVTGAVERAVVRDRFARFVPRAVVDDVLARADEDLRLGAQQRTATVLFSDVRGFTTFSESRSPDEVIAVLNRYLDAMSSAILEHGGTLVSYMGDGIMAVFGAPIPQDDHADRALAAADDMLGPRLREFNAWLREQGLSEGFRMGVGLNSGPVMSGMVGSEQRLEYTTIGDTTNTAARLEAMTKGTPHQLYVADSTRECLTREPDGLVFVDELPVRGRAATIKVWSIADEAGSSDRAVPGDQPVSSPPA